MLGDRVARNENGEGGLDWMKQDEGVRQQLTPNIPDIIRTGTTFNNYALLPGADKWSSYFDSNEDKNKREEFMENDVNIIKRESSFNNEEIKESKNWKNFHFKMENFISEKLELIINSFEKKVFWIPKKLFFKFYFFVNQIIKCLEVQNVENMSFVGKLNVLAKYLGEKNFPFGNEPSEVKNL